MCESTYLLHISNANFPMTADKRVYHLDLKAGEISNKIILVGDLNRAKLYADTYFEGEYFSLMSHRGYVCLCVDSLYYIIDTNRFLTCTGNYKGQRLSIVGTGMGTPMIDFSIREIRHLFAPDEKLVMIRLGTCGSPQSNIKLGTIVVNDGAVMINRNPDAFRNLNKGEIPSVDKAYRVSQVAYSDQKLSHLLSENAKRITGQEDAVAFGLDATGDSFYSSQGRTSDLFQDYNEQLIDYLCSLHEIKSIEMETFHLFDMAQCSNNSIVSTAAEIVLAARRSNEFINAELKSQREMQIGQAGLDTLVQYEI
jgi:uridine phosphorylase